MTYPSTLIFETLRLYSRLAPTEAGAVPLARFARNRLYPDQRRAPFPTPDQMTLNLDLDDDSQAAMALGLYKLGTARLIRRFLGQGSWFVDCGAGMGYFSIMAALLVGHTGRVDAYEPDPLNRKCFEANLRNNNLAGHIRLRPVAVGDEEKEITLHRPADAVGYFDQTSSTPSLLPNPIPFTVPAVRLDAELRRSPDLIKISVQGDEFAAIRGLSKLLSSENPPRLILQHDPRTSRAAGFHTAQILSYLLAAQPAYRIYRVGGQLHPIKDPASINQIPHPVNLLITP